MTEMQFIDSLLGAELGAYPYLADGMRPRYAVADALSARAKERLAEGRPDVSGRLNWAATQVRFGRPITKRVMGKLTKDIEVVRRRLVKGEE